MKQHYTPEQRQNLKRQTQELGQLKAEIARRGLFAADVAAKAGFHRNLLYTWYSMVRNKGYSRAYSEDSLRRIWAAVEALAPSGTKPNGPLPSEPMPIQTVAPGKHDAGKNALMQLIGVQMQEMSTVQLALLYAHIVGEEG